MVPRDDAVGEQRAEQRDRAGRVAAGIADARGLGDGAGLARAELREAVGPVGCGPVGGRGIEDLRRATVVPGDAVDDRDRIARGRVGQAEHDEVGGAHRVAPGGRVLAALGIDADRRDRQGAEPFADAEAGGAGLAVDEDRTRVGRQGGISAC